MTAFASQVTFATQYDVAETPEGVVSQELLTMAPRVQGVEDEMNRSFFRLAYEARSVDGKFRTVDSLGMDGGTVEDAQALHILRAIDCQPALHEDAVENFRRLVAAVSQHPDTSASNCATSVDEDMCGLAQHAVFLAGFHDTDFAHGAIKEFQDLVKGWPFRSAVLAANHIFGHMRQNEYSVISLWKEKAERFPDLSKNPFPYNINTFDGRESGSLELFDKWASDADGTNTFEFYALLSRMSYPGMTLEMNEVGKTYDAKVAEVMQECAGGEWTSIYKRFYAMLNPDDYQAANWAIEERLPNDYEPELLMHLLKFVMQKMTNAANFHVFPEMQAPVFIPKKFDAERMIPREMRAALMNIADEATFVEQLKLRGYKA